MKTQIPQTPTQVPVRQREPERQRQRQRRLPATTFAANQQQGVDHGSFLAALAYLETIKQWRPLTKADQQAAANMLVYLPTVPEKPKSVHTPNLYR